jgi:peptide/nickel transport system ATP-binding protein
MQLTEKEIRKMRKDIQIIFQDPYASLNPRMPIGKAIMEPMKVHGLYGSDKERELKALELLEKVGLDPDHFQRYPHEFSGGQRQRIGIARTIALQPKIIICDESVSALDISVQAQVLNLLNTLKEQYKFTYIFISHDLAVVKYMSDQLLVMKKGSIEEQGESDEIYKSPKKEYTKKLINAIPKGL